MARGKPAPPPSLPITRQVAIWGSFAAVAERHPHLHWEAEYSANAGLRVSLRLRSKHVRRDFVYAHRFAVLEIVDREYLPVYDTLGRAASDLWFAELEACQAST